MQSKEVDVVVAGGGTAGVMAGLAAARNGAKTLIVERQRCLGGQFTAGSQGAWVGFSDKQKRIVDGLVWELRNLLKERNAIVEADPETDVCFLYDTEVAKVVLNEMLAKEPGLATYFNTSIVDVLVEGNTVAGLVILSEMEQMEIRAKVVIDCSGDAAVAARAGVPFEIRAKKDIQPMTLIGRMAGVNIERVQQYYQAHPPVHDGAVPPAWRDYKTFPGFMHYGLRDELEDVDLHPHLEYLRNWLAIFTSTPNPGEVTINCSGAIEAHSIAGFEDRARQEIDSQRCLYDVAEALRQFVPGFENAYLSVIASQLGVRESRRIVGDYKVTLEDFQAAREFPDSIGRGAMPAGAHTADGVTMSVYDLPAGQSMTIPYRCMLPQTKEGLLIAGRCVSYEPPVANCIRNMAQCMVMGQAAGTAAALAVRHGATPRNVDIPLLQQTLREQGAIL
ncbi:MAG: FAD-dependent oxidoreductase [Anaerolineales bacterium]|nr:FAD-dependent oxidoreductase [Anaerolineales bacterium]